MVYVTCLVILCKKPHLNNKIVRENTQNRYTYTYVWICIKCAIYKRMFLV